MAQGLGDRVLRARVEALIVQIWREQGGRQRGSASYRRL